MTDTIEEGNIKHNHELDTVNDKLFQSTNISLSSNQTIQTRHESLVLETTSATNKTKRRKLQISNGYFLKFNQLARVLNYLLEHSNVKRITSKELQDNTGLVDRHIEGLISIGAAMGLIKPGLQVLTPIGLLIAQHDIFIENKGTIEWCHYTAAGSYRNLIWFEVFNHILAESKLTSIHDWNEHIRRILSDHYTERTINKCLKNELRFITDAYFESNFNKLDLLHLGPDEKYYLRRYTNFAPLVLAAMIYDYCASKEDHLTQVSELVITPGSPAMVFGLDAPSFRQQIEGLHERGWIRYETTHSLDQIRLKPGFSALEFLTAHFEDREPRQVANQVSRE